MKQWFIRKSLTQAETFTATSKKINFKYGFIFLFILTLAGISITLVIKAGSNVPTSGSAIEIFEPLAPVVQKPSRNHLHNLLSLQPQASRMRRKLGQRYVNPGREISVVVGQLTVGNERHSSRITRTQGDGGEQVRIELDGTAETLRWTPKDGAKLAGRLSE